ncbi:MAG: hypothetical protein ACJ0IB_00795 [Verrucomicrobiales bacterium]
MEPHKDLLQIEDLSKEEIESILAAAQPFKELFKRSVKKVPTLQGKTVLSLFYEPSTQGPVHRLRLRLIGYPQISQVLP